MWNGERNWEDRFGRIVKLAAGALLFATPWLGGFANARVAALNAWIGGLAIAALSLSALSDPEAWKERLIAGIGAWIWLSPPVLGFEANAAAAGIHAGLGLLVALLGLLDLWKLHEDAPRQSEHALGEGRRRPSSLPADRPTVESGSSCTFLRPS